MSLIRPFTTFEPLTGDVPQYPFTYLPEIAWRARARLKSRSREQIEVVARKISEEIDGYFLDLKDTAIAKLQGELDVRDKEFDKFFQWDGGTRANGRWFFRDEMEDELGILTAENCSEVDALKAVIEKRDDCFFQTVETEPREYVEGKDFEMFAVLSLSLQEDALVFLDKSQLGISIAGEYALKAMDAVCHSEHLHEAERLVSSVKQTSQNKLNAALIEQKAECQKWVKYCAKIDKERKCQERSEKARKLNHARHQRTRDAKKMAVAEWEMDTSRFPSAEKAGLYLADWLVARDFSYEPRTVTGWIRSHAKQIGVRFR